MVIPTTSGPVAHAPTHQLDDLQAELRAIYTRAFGPAHQAAEDVGSRFEPADGTTPLDPVYAADIAGCRAINAELASVVERHLPGARLLAQVDESPAVIDSRWILGSCVVVIEWDYTHDFGDPDALNVREVTR